MNAYSIALLATLASEGALVYGAFSRVGHRAFHILAAILFVNTLTHGSLWASWPLILPTHSYYLRLVVAESVIVVIEALLYPALLSEVRLFNAAWVSVSANILSTGLVVLIWRLLGQTIS